MNKKLLGLLLSVVLCLSFSCAKMNTNESAKKEKSPALIGNEYNGNILSSVQQEAASGVIERLLGKDIAKNFRVEIVESKDGNDYFEVEPLKDKIILRGTNGVSACRGLKWYLNEKCSCSITWRGDNLNLPNELPKKFQKYKESTPFKYRYIFNNCIYGYSMPWWSFKEWERMLDVLAFNGINMPAMLLGQEKAWQETYKEIGLDAKDLDTFFAGPAWYPWQWMGNLDGWGGPLPQSIIDKQCKLQQDILSRARSLGMKAVLPGFSGHIPKALVNKVDGLKYHTMEWWGFGPNYLLDWQDPMFKKISSTFMKKQRELYGTDHYYNIDPFNEMTPPSNEKTYLTNMSKTIFSCIDESDPQGVWVMMTWFCKMPDTDGFWNAARTKDFFDAVPDDRVLALELWGDNWNGTAWYKQSGWYNKPWVWSILQNFGNRVDIYGPLESILTNYNKVKDSPDKGRIQGMGIMTEGLDYNPVIYELVLDMMWGKGVENINQWKQHYLEKRYGSVPETVKKAWDILYKTRYTKTDLVTISPLCKPPALVETFEADMDMINAWELMKDAIPQVKNSPAFQFDLVNTGRETMGDFAPYYTLEIQAAYKAKDLERLKKADAKMLQYIKDFDRLTGTNENLLLGEWIAGARELAADEKEKNLMEWGAKRQITDWGGQIGSYAIKEWSGYFSDCMLPAWELYLSKMEEALSSGKEFDKKAADAACAELLKKWPDKRSNLPAKPVEDPFVVTNEMWNKYGKDMKDFYKSPAFKDARICLEVPGLAVSKKATATGQEPGRDPQFAVDGKLSDKFWAAKGPASLTVDLGDAVNAAAFQVFTYYKDERYYQYTIEISADGQNWIKVVDMSENKEKSTISGKIHKFTAGYSFRYAKLNMLKNSANSSVHVVEFKVLSDEDLAAISKKQND